MSAFDPYYAWLAIRPEEQPADHYRLLGLRRLEDEADVITNAVDQRVNYLQTLLGGQHAALAQRLIEEVRAAGDCLLDPRQKARYDRELLARIEQAAAAVTPAPAAPLLEAAGLSGAASIRPLPLPTSFRTPSPPPKAPATKSNSSAQIAVVAACLAALAVAGVAVIAGTRWLQTSTPEGANRPVPPRPQAQTPRGPTLPASEPPAKPSPSAITPAATSTADAPPAELPGTSDAPSAAPPTSPVAPPEKQTIDLLAAPNAELRVPWGAFNRVGNELVLEGKANALEFPQPLPAEYVLEIEVIRELGDNSLCCTLPVGDRVLTAIVDGFYSKVSGLAAINDREIFTPNSPHAVAGKRLTNGRPATIRIEVSEGLVRLGVDEKRVTEWKREEDVPIRAAKGMGVTDPRKLTIFTWEARYRFQRIAVTPLNQPVSSDR